MSLPLGPFLTATLQPFRLPLRVRGETIVQAEPAEGGYGGRGVSALAEGETLDDVLPLVERSCSVAGGAHRLALCMAVEEACGIRPTRYARLVRALFAEVERAQARLWTLALLARAFGLSDQFGVALEQREVLFAGVKQATGFRMYPGIVVPGGVRTDLDLAPLRDALRQLGKGVIAWRLAASMRGPLGRRGDGVGVISASQVAELHLAGLAASGLGAASDLRRAGAYGEYADLAIEWTAQTEDSGDIAARARLMVEDIATSLTVAQACFAMLNDVAPDEPIELPELKGNSIAAEATIEGTHGAVTVACVLSSEMHVRRLEILTPALDVFDGLEELVMGHSLAHLPAFLVSLDLCLECVDQ